MHDSTIHPTAIVDAGARLGPGCVILAHAIIGRHCVLQAGVTVHPFAVIGGAPQDLGFKHETESEVHVGTRTVIREHVTINRATKAGGATRVGADCFLMASSHIAHDCQLGDRVILANAVLLAGHVHIGNHAFLGGGSVVHQFSRIGESAMIAGGCRIVRDVAPYCLATARIHGLNRVGLRRRGFKPDLIRELKAAFHEMNAVGSPRELARSALDGGRYKSAEAKLFLEFFLSGRRPFARMSHIGDDIADD
jgi:UDP-N-acetylglucosamine acyltransferase